MINKVYFRCDQDARDYEGENPRNWHGEDAFCVGDRIQGKPITLIGKMYDETNGQCSIGVFVGAPVQLYCEIPMSSVTRLFYSLNDGTVSE